MENCNNIESGEINIIEGALNIKYALNGTGKSTIAKAIDAFVHGDSAKIKELVPFKYMADIENNMPTVRGIEGIRKIAVFNEDYINQYVFQENELIKNSFEIFVKTQD